MTISPDYLEQQKLLHQNPNYGVASLTYGPIVAEIASQTQARSISDYGAGKCNLRRKLHELGRTDLEYHPYDPAFPEYGRPQPADLVCCIDVLEHVEPEHLEAVLSELAGITRKLAFFTIHTGPAVKHLPDGRNAHLIQEPASWWLPRLSRHLEIFHLQRAAGGFWMLLEPLSAPQR